MRQNFQHTELIDKVIRSIKKGPFDMRCWQMCICGHIMRVEGKTPQSLPFLEPLCLWGAKRLGITEEQAIDLFQTNMCASRRDAIRCLKILRDEGVVDWDRASGGPQPYLFFNDRLGRAHADFDRLCEEAKALA